MVLTVFSVLSPAQQQPLETTIPIRSDQQLLLQFSQQSAGQLVARYFQGPSYPLFVIRRLIDVADPRVMPDLRDAFSRETQPHTLITWLHGLVMQSLVIFPIHAR